MELPDLSQNIAYPQITMSIVNEIISQDAQYIDVDMGNSSEEIVLYGLDEMVYMLSDDGLWLAITPEKEINLIAYAIEPGETARVSVRLQAEGERLFEGSYRLYKSFSTEANPSERLVFNQYAEFEIN